MEPTGTGNRDRQDRTARRKAIEHAALTLLHLVSEHEQSAHVRVMLALDGPDVRIECTRLSKGRLQ